MGVLLGLSACTREKTEEVPVSTTMLTSATEERARRPDVASFLDEDPALTQRVEASIADDAELSIGARNVNVTVERSIATLSGTVADYATRDAVMAAAERTEGIRKVYSDVQVSPLHDEGRRASDENIAFSLQRSLVNEPRVTIDVEEGVVTLRGESEAPAEELERVVYRTPGVAAVVNGLGASEESTPPSTLVQ
jgi:osmotically-inducible protein OsmY